MMQATEIATKKKTRKKPGDSILPRLGRLAKGTQQFAKEIEKAREEARASEVKRAEDSLRLVTLVRLGFANRFEGTVKHHPAYTPDDLAFFRTFGFAV
jgi:hypothetical protein